MGISKQGEAIASPWSMLGQAGSEGDQTSDVGSCILVDGIDVVDIFDKGIGLPFRKSVVAFSNWNCWVDGVLTYCLPSL